MAEQDRIAEFKEVLELMPEDPVVRFGLAGAYLDAGQAENAVVGVSRSHPPEARLLGGVPGARALPRAGWTASTRRRRRTRSGLEVATRNGDLQTKKEIEVFLRRLDGPAG